MKKHIHLNDVGPAVPTSDLTVNHCLVRSVSD